MTVSRASEYRDRAGSAEMMGAICYGLAILLLIAAIVAGAVEYGTGLSPLPSLFPFGGSGIMTLVGRRCLRRRDHWANEAHAERVLANEE